MRGQFAMPEYFALFDPGTSKKSCRVVTAPHHKSIYLNQKDWEDPRGKRHRFISLGDAWHAVRTINADPDERVFRNVVMRSLGDELPSALLTDWKEIFDIRNTASHVEPLSRNDYETVMGKALSPYNLRPLLQIKDRLSRDS